MDYLQLMRAIITQAAFKSPNPQQIQHPHPHPHHYQQPQEIKQSPYLGPTQQRQILTPSN